MPERGGLARRPGVTHEGIHVDEGALKILIRREMEHAAVSRQEGSEGRARVCARRAAGWAVIHLNPSGSNTPEPGNAYESLRWLQDQMRIEEPVRQAARRLTTRLTPEHELPFSEDPLQDAELVIKHVFKQDWRMFPLD